MPARSERGVGSVSVGEDGRAASVDEAQNLSWPRLMVAGGVAGVSPPHHHT
jgi:hypothetical protein